MTKRYWSGKLGSRLAGGLLLTLGLTLGGDPLVTQNMGPTRVQDVESSLDNAGQLAGPQKLSNAEGLLSRMKDILKHSYDTLGSARSEKDLVKMNCVNEKLTSQKGLLKISEQAFIQLQDAVAQADSASSNHEYTKISIAYQKMQGLGVETEGCAGEALRYTGDTKIDVEIDSNITGEDPTIRDQWVPILDEHPESTSPFN